jgi:PEP-CTERM motif
MKRSSLMIILLALSVGFISANAKATMTIATFADPSGNSSHPLFTVDFLGGTLTGGWADGKTGLTLEIPCSGYTIENGNAFHDVWFEMTRVGIDAFGDTGGGEIDFYAHGTTTNPLLTINFGSGFVSRYGFGADELFTTDNVTIESSKITNALSEEEFSFSFANKKKLSADPKNNGFTATAAFTSSAAVEITNTHSVVPEPATICILGLGALSLVRRKNSA